MKLIFKLMLLALLLIGISPFLLHGSNGKPILSLDKRLPLDLAHLFSRIRSAPVAKTRKSIKLNTKDPLPILDDDNTTVHKWRDKTGVWHFSDTRNPHGKDDVVLINTNTNTNVIQANPKAENSPATQKNDRTTDKKENTNNAGAGIPFPTTIPMKDIPKLIKDTRILKETMNRRYKEQQKQINSIQSQ